MRKCSKCGKYLPKNEFTSHSTYCRTCRRDYKWQYTYGISPEQYYALYQQQEGKCKICGKELPEGQYLCVDHNAENGEIRGLLCSQCNKGLGFFHDDTDVMKNAIKYLEENE